MASSEPGRALAPGIYAADDLRVGDRWTTPHLTLSEWHVLQFAGLTGDFFELHMDDGFARTLGFPGRVAHGLLGLALLDGLKNRAEVRLRAIASLGWSWDFAAPLCVGDRIRGLVEVTALRATSDGRRAVASLAMRLVRDDGTTLQAGENRLMLERRAGSTRTDQGGDQ